MSKKQYKINEIFYSIQGEGSWTGEPAIFIRFSGCNLNCSFCDTKHEAGKLFTAEEIKKQIYKLPCRTIILTGGEPMLQIDIDLLETIGVERNIHLETNGTRSLKADIINRLFWVTVSPKYPWNQICGDELKIIMNKHTKDELLQIFNSTKENFSEFFLQPKYKKNERETIRMVKRLGGLYRLSLQSQKLGGFR